MATFPCPSCERPLEAEDTYRDWTVRCPHCAVEFVPEEVAREVFYPESMAPFDPDAERHEREEALARAYNPGICLELCGWLFGFLIELSAFFHVIVGLAQMNAPNVPRNQAEVTLIMGMTFGLLGVPYALVLIVGGRKMRELTSLRWALMASLCAVCSFVFLFVLCVCALLPPLFGLWGFLTLSNPAVRRTIEANRRLA